MRKYLLHILIISFVFLLAPTAQIASSAETYEEYSKRMDEERAVENAKEEVRKNPDDALAHFFLGNAYSNSGKYQKAIKSFKQAIRIDPDFAGAHIGLGDAYYKSSKYKEAIESYKQAIRIKPDDAKAHCKLSIAYLMLNDRGSALEQYKILKNLDTELANKLFNKIYK